MTEYRIVIERPAQRDLFDIIAYISDTLREPGAAMRIYGALKRAVMTLAQMPQRYPVIAERPYATAGVRRLLVENYAVFYIADVSDETVHILRVLYNRREWQSLITPD